MIQNFNAVKFWLDQICSGIRNDAVIKMLISYYANICIHANSFKTHTIMLKAFAGNIISFQINNSPFIVLVFYNGSAMQKSFAVFKFLVINNSIVVFIVIGNVFFFISVVVFYYQA